MTDPALTVPDEIVGGLSDDLRGRVKSELEPGERLLWASVPLVDPERIAFGTALGLLSAVAFLLFAVAGIVWGAKNRIFRTFGDGHS